MDEAKMKKCFKCNETKELSEFYKHKAMLDGHVNKCKECNKKDVQENRKVKIEYYTEYEKRRANLPHRVDARIKYAETETGKESHNKAKRKWNINNVDKRRASLLVNSALKKGEIVKPEKCQLCGAMSKRLEGHHYDYNEPLSVTWLCSACHRLFHKNRTLSSNFNETQQCTTT